MSAFLLWVIVPIVVGAGLFFLRKFYFLSVIAGAVFSLFSALAAYLLPMDREIQIGRFLLFISSRFSIFGRQFIFEPQDRPLLIVVYLLAAFWFFGIYWAKAGRMVVPLGLVAIALLISALTVDPFLYSGLFIALAVLVCVPILSPPGLPVQRGVLRFLTSLSLGVPFILFSGWLLTGVETRPGDLRLVNQAAGMLMLGFVFIVGLFPFHTWVLMLAEKTHPYAAGFVFVIFPWMTSLFGLGFLDNYPWLRSEQFLLVIRWIGAGMVMVSGIWAAFEKHLGRLFGYAALMETGLILAAASLPKSAGLLFELGIPRTVSLAVWALALSWLRLKTPDLRFQTVAGFGRSSPFASGALILAQLSVAGFPLLAGFPLRLSIWFSMAENSFFVTLALVFGSIGMLASGIRVLAVLVAGGQEDLWSITEDRFILVLIIFAVCFLFIYGLFPQLFTTPFFDVLNTVQ